MRRYYKKYRMGHTLTELIVTMIMGSMLTLTVGVMLVSGQRAWNKAYNSANHRLKQDAQAISIAFGTMGRRANRLNYVLYDVDNGVFTPVESTTGDEEVLYGDAVEFRYWDVELDSEDSHGLLNVNVIATAYALFYMDDNLLKVDYGSYPPGGVPDGGGARNTNDVTTIVLSEFVDTETGGRVLTAEELEQQKQQDQEPVGVFSHTTSGGTGQGCVRIRLRLTDPESDISIDVREATLLRNVWPR